MKKLWDLKKVFSNLEPEGQGRGIIMGVTRLLLLGSFYTIQTNFMYFFAHDCNPFLICTTIYRNCKQTHPFFSFSNSIVFYLPLNINLYLMWKLIYLPPFCFKSEFFVTPPIWHWVNLYWFFSSCTKTACSSKFRFDLKLPLHFAQWNILPQFSTCILKLSSSTKTSSHK